VKRRATILLAHGGGGRLTRELVEGTFLPAFRNPALAALSDSAVLDSFPPGRPALTTDAFVVDPLEFPGGDLGSLAVCGTVNDLAVAGAVPLALTFAVILEEGLDAALLDRLVGSAAAAAHLAGVEIVAGDTKVVPRGKGDRAYAVTAGLGVVPPGRELGDQRVAPGDVMLVSGAIAEHGATILACRHGLAGDLRSDVAPINHLVEKLLRSDVEVHAMHDPTRGGVATTCCEVARRTGARIILDEADIPVEPATAAVCDLLGLDPLYLASEGRFLAWVAASDAQRALTVLRGHPSGRGAAAIGHVGESNARLAPVVLRSRYGVDRPLDMLSGSEVPRIC
jgi:hydrogenase expression/formation protein HypE